MFRLRVQVGDALTQAVRHTAELQRILQLPRRSEVDLEALAAEMTELLRTPKGTMRLRPVQALALHDIGTVGGGFLPVGVGEGKTLISLLAAYVLDAKSPLLLLPASLIEKTQREMRHLMQHWLIPTNIRMMSYEMLGRAQSAAELDTYKPDLVVDDEVHKLKNKRAAVTRRVGRYMHENPGTRFVGMSGTIMRKSLCDFGHILRWALKGNAPVPKTTEELEEWASALDEVAKGKPGDELSRLEPGALLQFATREPTSSGTDLERARRGFRARLTETPGVVATAGDSERVDCSIYIKAHVLKVAPITEQHFRTLRGDRDDRDRFPGWLTPDGWPLSQGVDVWRVARELALGLHYIWDPRPPKEWMEPRKAWSAFVREVLSHSRTLDSELQVAQACAAGRLPDEALRAWQAVRDTFKPNSVAVWHDDSALKFCAEWAKTPGIVWTEHSFFAERLAELTGLPYFGAKGLTSSGQFIDDADSTRAAIVSIDANREGRNLQGKWSRNLVVSPPEGADVWQQMLGRTHRPGQTADEVEVDILWGCREHVNAWRKALAGTIAVRDTVGGAPAKLLLADVNVPSEEEVDRFVGWRW